MTIIKLVFLLIPIIILSILAIVLFSVRGMLFKKDNKKISNEMITCFSCGISVHESLIFKKNSKNYCSDNCANS
jgi:type IV secretory pathway VirB3-like protein